ncbi:MAG: quinolinate synthase [Deltaproteobacteria bacterium]|nr:MAG: quinolinate synthase [Deltaproteobacteria bacterium]
MINKGAREIIKKKKAELGSKLVILGHHYQGDEVIEFCDYIGDSLELARRASRIKEAEMIVFCGVYFMAETASILAPQKSVFIPDPTAGCPLADMARTEDIERAWEVIISITKHVTPVTYVNSSALTKAFCGRQGGVVCTSGNANKVFSWAFERTDKIVFFPDRSLGKNTASSLRIPENQVVEWDPADEMGGLDEDMISKAKVIVWKGWCPVHWPQLSPSDVYEIKSRYPGAKVIVHPETDPETVKASDMAGSTARILDYLKSLPPGETLAIGTEFNMVNRAARDFGKVLKILPLKKVLCKDMAKITVEKLAKTLSDPENAHKVKVPDSVAGEAKIALERMLKI